MPINEYWNEAIPRDTSEVLEMLDHRTCGMRHNVKLVENGKIPFTEEETKLVKVGVTQNEAAIDIVRSLQEELDRLRELYTTSCDDD